jgi:hypothetical protein
MIGKTTTVLKYSTNFSEQIPLFCFLYLWYW